MTHDELDRRSFAEASRIRAEADAIADTEQALAAVMSLADQATPVERVDIAPPARRPRLTGGLVACAAVVVVAIAGGAVLFALGREHRGDNVKRNSPATPTAVERDVTTEPTVATETTATSDPTTDPTIDPLRTDASGWYVPTWIPDGFRIAGASAIDRTLLVGHGFRFDVWVDRSDGGSGRLQWQSTVETPLGTSTAPEAPYVRGVPAMVDDVDGATSVQWTEGDRTHRVASSLERETTLAIIEAAAIDDDGAVALDPVTLPTGFEWIDPQLADARLDRDIGGFGAERREVAGIERNVRSNERDDGTVQTRITWYVDGYAFFVEAQNLDSAIVEAFVAGITSADQAAFLAFEQEITDRGLASPVFDQATFADGLTVSLRSPDGEAFIGNEAWRREGYLCVEAHSSVCAAPGPSSLFQIDDRKTYIMWTRDPMGDVTILGSYAPPSYPADLASSTAGQQLAAGAVVLTTEQVVGAHSTFVRIELPDDVRYVNVHRTDGASAWIVDGEILDLPVDTTGGG
jgi:hypothetical protein